MSADHAQGKHDSERLRKSARYASNILLTTEVLRGDELYFEVQRVVNYLGRSMEIYQYGKSEGTKDNEL